MSRLSNDMEIAELSFGDQIKYVLKTFGFDELWPKQQECIESIVKNSDCVISLPAGSGKSFCFQSAGLMTPGITLVVCHAKNIIFDQVEALKQLNIKAEYLLHWPTNGENNERVMGDLRATSPETKFIFVCPERLENQDFMDILSKLKEQDHLSRIVIDEVLHLINPEHSFRTAFENLLTLRRDLPLVPIIALTAACRPENFSQIISDLHLNTPKIVQGNLVRPNIKYTVENSESIVDTLNRVTELLSDNKYNRRKYAPALVYCRKKENCNKLADLLNRNGVKAAALHGSTGYDVWEDNQKKWISNEIEVLCVTVAFGTINHPKLRLVIHANMPASIEYYQLQTNQAGRNGKSANCLIFYNSEDKDEKISLINYDGGDNMRCRLRKFEELIRICTTSICRRVQLMEHYNYESPTKCDTALCDICRK